MGAVKHRPSVSASFVVLSCPISTVLESQHLASDSNCGPEVLPGAGVYLRRILMLVDETPSVTDLVHEIGYQRPGVYVLISECHGRSRVSVARWRDRDMGRHSGARA